MPILSSGDIIRKAGKSTLVLQVLSGTLLVVLLLLFVDISSRFRYLQDGVRENAVWSVYQLDREARTLQHALGEARFTDGDRASALGRMRLRYDILYSRLMLVRESRFGSYFFKDPTIEQLLNDSVQLILSQEALFDDLAKGSRPQPAAFDALAADLETLTDKSGHLLLRTNALVSDERADSRAMVLQLEKTSAVMLFLLLASVIFLVVTLRRQLKSTREAGLSLETMTHELGKAYEAADAGNRAKSQFMATMSHEVRTPLNAILGMAELLQLSDLPEEASENVRTIRSSGEALLEVINEILDYSKIEHGNLDLEERIVDIRQLATDTVGIMRVRAAEQHSAIVLDIPDNLQAACFRSDPTRLRQVLLNLLSNAAKFTSNGTVTLRLREFYRDTHLMLRVEVEDTGIGIDQAGIAKLFKPFSQVDASISRRYGGTGLGLTICKQIVGKLGGELGVSSTVGVGSIFWFELAVTPADLAEPDLRAKVCELRTELPTLRILLVEDNLVNQRVATGFLKRLGQHVTVAEHGQHALEILATESFDVIFMDMQMPVMDGIEATRQIVERGGAAARTPIIAMTANASDDDRQRCLEAGMVGFESKPMTMQRLGAVIAGLAEGREDPAADGAGSPAQALEGDAFGLGDVPGLDPARRGELVEALGDEVFSELIESFFNDAGDLLDDLHAHLTGGDAAEIDRLLHTIKGAAANVGLKDIARHADTLRSEPPTEAGLGHLGDEIEIMKHKLVA
ncbi:ATP-binding protein [Rhizobium halophytocola]|uniref:histidine kinase n=1 Tax=Rhizobium halophytocola TaxID=735519 RepID=A0ABS4E083_9HYPH|nr:signal transduction histidine kinase/CheY-like chemotaxis protein/HPt (histidine-containing phosphotransfer) domain-containing protein [Rhizobium halophytocola]